MKHIKLYEEFVNDESVIEALNPMEFENAVKNLAYSMPNHTKYDTDGLPSDEQIMKAMQKHQNDLYRHATTDQKKEAVEMVKQILSESVINEAVKVDIDLAQITVDVLADENKKFHYEFYITNMERDMIKDRYGKLPRGFAGPTTSMLAGEILSPLAGDDIYTDDVDLVKGDKTVMTLKPSTTWADVKKALKI